MRSSFPISKLIISQFSVARHTQISSKMPLAYTKTIEAMLTPIAEAITQFIVVNQDAEQHGLPMPDLHPTAQAVVAAVSNLLELGKQLVGASQEPQIQASMPPACNILTTASDNLLGATKSLQTDPHNAAARKRMLDGAKGLLEGTAAVLEVLDESEVGKIVALANFILQQLAIVHEVKTTQDLVVYVKGISQTLVALAKAVDNRQKELLSTRVQEGLIEAVEVLRKAPLLISALKTVVQNPNDVNAITNRDMTVRQLADAANDVLRLVQLKVVDEKAAAQNAGDRAKDIETIHALFSGFLAGINGLEGLGSGGNLNAHIASILSSTTSIAQQCKDPVRKQGILDAAAKVKDLHQKVVAAAELCRKNPKDAAAARALEDLVCQLDVACSHLERVVGDAIIEDLSSAFDSLTPAVGAALSAAAKSGDKVDLERQATALTNTASVLVRAAKDAAAGSSDVNEVNRIRQLAGAVDRLTPQIIACARIVAANPTDKSAADNLEMLIKDYDTKIKELQGAIDNVTRAEEFVEVAVARIKNEIVVCKAAAKSRNAPQFQSAVSSIESRANRVLQVARKEIENSEDPEYKQKVEQSMNKLQQALPSLLSAAKASYDNPTDAAATTRLDQASDAVCAAMDGVRNAVKVDVDRLVENMKALTADEHAEFEPEPTPVPSNPIAAAAHSLAQETRKWDDKGNTLVKSAKSLSEQMAKMAEFAERPEAKKELITAAKSMAGDIAEIIKMARAVAESCGDKRLKQTLLTLCDRIPTIATQLKIISSVKAANPHDTEADAQLITCAQNLMATVSQTVQAAEAASIKTIRSAANVVVAGIAWKKKVYKKRV